jgi:hypothetical protein
VVVSGAAVVVDVVAGIVVVVSAAGVDVVAGIVVVEAGAVVVEAGAVVVVVSAGIVAGGGSVVGGNNRSMVTGGQISAASAAPGGVVTAYKAAIRMATAPTAAARLPDMGRNLTDRAVFGTAGGSGTFVGHDVFENIAFRPVRGAFARCGRLRR